MRVETKRLSARTAVATALAVAASLANAATQSFDVFAKDNSVAFLSLDAAPLDTGLDFGAGDALSISAVGLWNGGACGDVDASGTACFGDEPVTGINYYSLIGKIGADASFDSSWFKVGTSFGGPAPTSGRLFLAFLDSDSFNNSGFVTATVEYTAPVPEPETFALMLAGLGSLALVLRRRPS
jgi:PEP-CTERM motif